MPSIAATTFLWLASMLAARDFPCSTCDFAMSLIFSVFPSTAHLRMVMSSETPAPPRRQAKTKETNWYHSIVETKENMIRLVTKTDIDRVLYLERERLARKLETEMAALRAEPAYQYYVEKFNEIVFAALSLKKCPETIEMIVQTRFREVLFNDLREAGFPVIVLENGNFEIKISYLTVDFENLRRKPGENFN